MGTQKSQNLPDRGESGQPRRNRENLVLRSPRAVLPRSGTVVPSAKTPARQGTV